MLSKKHFIFKHVLQGARRDGSEQFDVFGLKFYETVFSANRRRARGASRCCLKYRVRDSRKDSDCN